MKMNYFRQNKYAESGSVLIIVVGCVAFLTILVLAFFASVSTERQSAQVYANNSSVKLLGDSAVSIVIGQIKDATKGSDNNTALLSWASQPGMIRTYNTSGQAEAYYKLYSWANMIGAGSFNPSATSETPPSTWSSSPALYTDLNDPVSGVYPIVDPAATQSVQGFSITGAPTSATDAAPMPVQWLYVLQDGTLAAPSGGIGNIVTVAAASASNPIVSRIAFWADDDTCKVNINTAAGDIWWSAGSPPAIGQPGNPGSFWDTPRTANFSFEKTNLAKYQPAQNEYQRYPGHPATTYLSSVFTNLTIPEIDQINPRIGSGGSVSGTQIATTSVVPNGQRLYASVDELMFTPNMASAARTTTSPFTEIAIEQAKFFLTAHSRAPEVNLFNEPRVVIWPESVNNDITHRTPYDSLIAFCGTLNTNTYYFQRDTENVVGAAVTTGADSATDDLPITPSPTGLGRNRSLISYLRNQTALPVPGFSTGGETFLSKYPKDRDEILTEIFDYIRSANSEDQSVTGLVPDAAPSGTVSLASTGVGGVAGQGQIVPITDSGHADSNSNTLRGLGRFPTVREAVIVFVGVGQTKAPLTSTMPTANANSSAAPIADGKTRVQAFFTLNFFDPNLGYALCSPNFKVNVQGLNGFTWSGTPMGFPASSTSSVIRNYNTGAYGGYKGASSMIGDSGYACFSMPIDMTTGGTFAFTGGSVQVQILDDSPSKNVLQTLTMNIPSGTFPVPQLAPYLTDSSQATTMYVDYRNLTKYTGSFGSLPVPVGRFTGANVNTAYSTSAKMWICGKDVVRSVEANTDVRLIAAMKTVPASYFSEIEPQYSNPTVAQVHSVAEAESAVYPYPCPGAWFGKLVPNADYGTPSGTGSSAIPVAGSDFTYTGTFTADGLQPKATPSGPPDYFAPIVFGMNSGQCVAANGVYAGTNATPSLGSTLPNPPGDWDTGMSVTPDGAFDNKVDEGSINGLSGSTVPYFDSLVNAQNSGGTFFSPNRQMPSPVMFGSLPTGVESNQPWQTLLFRPDPGGTPQHIGAQSPPDYLLLDLFNMPVVEPYAISDPFSTAGKVNMNYQIVPFTYITRSTGVQAVLKPEQILALKNSDSNVYKSSTGTCANRRNFLDIDQTLVGFQNMFATGTTSGTGSTPDIFRSASQICNIWLVPQGQTYAGMPKFWSNYLLTGDNIRERPYANIYPRLTTKSNTFTIHYRVQTLKKVPSTPAAQWVEGTDVTTAEYRGSSTVERYLDTGANIPDYATLSQPPSAGQAIDNYYKFRVIETKQFPP